VLVAGGVDDAIVAAVALAEDITRVLERRLERLAAVGRVPQCGDFLLDRLRVQPAAVPPERLPILGPPSGPLAVQPGMRAFDRLVPELLFQRAGRLFVLLVIV
jgi:hypothetical protein